MRKAALTWMSGGVRSGQHCEMDGPAQGWRAFHPESGWKARLDCPNGCNRSMRLNSVPVLLPAWVLLWYAMLPVHAQNVASTAMVTIPAGPFTMGNNTGPADERPAHQVHLGAFVIDHALVTNAQFAAFLHAVGPVNAQGERLFDVEDRDARMHRVGGVWIADAGFADYPVVEVSWLGARDYCAWQGKRLPTEAAWEKAARGTDGRMYPWGESPPNRTLAQSCPRICA